MRRLALLVVMLAAVLCGCGGGSEAKPHLAADYRGTPARVGGLQEPARVRGDYVELSTADHGFQPRFWPGVTGEQHYTELADIGRLRWGTANPKQRGFDDRVLVASKGHTIEVRLPWMMLGYSDPSSHQVMVPHSHAAVTSKRTGRIEIETVAGGQALRTAGYDWEDWNIVSSHERRKVGWGVLAAEFDRSAAPPKRR